MSGPLVPFAIIVELVGEHCATSLVGHLGAPKLTEQGDLLCVVPYEEHGARGGHVSRTEPLIHTLQDVAIVGALLEATGDHEGGEGRAEHLLDEDGRLSGAHLVGVHDQVGADALGEKPLTSGNSVVEALVTQGLGVAGGLGVIDRLARVPVSDEDEVEGFTHDGPSKA